jgi:hypothetical protein
MGLLFLGACGHDGEVACGIADSRALRVPGSEHPPLLRTLWLRFFGEFQHFPWPAPLAWNIKLLLKTKGEAISNTHAFQVVWPPLLRSVLDFAQQGNNIGHTRRVLRSFHVYVTAQCSHGCASGRSILMLSSTDHVMARCRAVLQWQTFIV